MQANLSNERRIGGHTMRKDGTLTSRERRELWIDEHDNDALETKPENDPYELLFPDNYEEPQQHGA